MKFIAKKLNGDELLLDHLFKGNEVLEEEAKQKGPRSRERKICEVLKYIFVWRKYYNGFKLQGTSYQSNLQRTAKKLGIPKKSLDEYFSLVK